MANHPPEFPWIKGVQPDYRAFIIRVGVCQDNDTNVWSHSDLEDETDAHAAESLPSHGVEQIAFGLLCEAIRREAYLQVLMRLTKDNDYLDKLAMATPESRKAIMQELQAATKGSLKNSVDRMAEAACEEITLMLSDPA
jgi:hypothetical protein